MGMMRFGLVGTVFLLTFSGRAIAQNTPPLLSVDPVAPLTAPPTTPLGIPLPTVSPNTPVMVTSPAFTPVEESIRLVVQRGKRRVLVYRGTTVLAKYPIAVGKTGWETPIGDFKVLTKEENPVFKSFKTGMIIEPGPDNPLGVRWIGIWTDGKTQLGFHGTDQPELIGKAVSHGCIRMHNKDVVALYKLVEMGTMVTVQK
ncbi:MAG: L,D-transpeptidase [Cyanobacteria bacterium]|nr:L,D-transpeptidase [Cyanobacteriota bacterium]